ncbi:4Fe-4S binding protein [Acidithrix sp. C25]|uniref:4Fe-4S binding protein n=1 Tax=Acidithrix sp. C25 TaxID=1671482 RepID=UPI00191BA81F|nr:4Fe-4S binding protein [Acidithrix sp. C25]CAG4914683.1 unnamed protein product [Acidithrix sp. C25]
MTYVTDPKTKAMPFKDEDDPRKNVTSEGRLDPVAVAIRLRPKVETDMASHFAPSDPKLDLSRTKPVKAILKKRWLQFALIVPNQLIFWLVIFSGLIGTVVPGLNFATAITWYIWFCIVFVLMVVVGRAWCVMCPFGGFGEWIQRKTFFKKTQKSLGFGLKYPKKLAAYGLVSSAVSFLVLTYIEEFFNIAGPGAPHDTAYMVLGIVAFATITFLVFERRTFCRYLCPLSALIGSVGSMGSIAGFRTKDRNACQSCSTKSCMRGGEEGYGCPWYTWVGSADSNSLCGLCTECYKSCPTDNIGLYAQAPLTSVIQPNKKRMDIAVVSAILLGLVVFQQVNALSMFTSLDDWLNKQTHFPQYPNPIDYVGFIALFALVPVAIYKVGAILFSKGTIATTDGTFMTKRSEFRNWFISGSYALLPAIGADYFARQLPKFFKHATRIVPAVAHPFGGTAKALYNYRLLSDSHIVMVQVAIMIIGTLASLYAAAKISKRDLVLTNKGSKVAYAYFAVAILAMSIPMTLLYIPMHAAN